MAVPKRKSSKIKFKYSLLKRNLQQKVQKSIVNIKNLKQNLNKYKRKFY
jgi:ribosomal protein L32